MEEKMLAKTKMLPGRAAERRLARFCLPELLQRRRVVHRPPAPVCPRSAFSAGVEWVVGVHRSRARMPFPHHLDHAVAGEMCAEEFRCFYVVALREAAVEILYGIDALRRRHAAFCLRVAAVDACGVDELRMLRCRREGLQARIVTIEPCHA